MIKQHVKERQRERCGWEWFFFKKNIFKIFWSSSLHPYPEIKNQQQGYVLTCTFCLFLCSVSNPIKIIINLLYDYYYYYCGHGLAYNYKVWNFIIKPWFTQIYFYTLPFPLLMKSCKYKSNIPPKSKRERVTYQKKGELFHVVCNWGQYVYTLSLD